MHDSADYYQLKVSVFTDDKKTDLIGEAWVDLKAIVIPGGGQNDLWQTLTCRGKYAGEIRVEITYYDTRPSPEKPVAARSRQSMTVEREGSPTKQRTPMMKRRPLPFDPVTGEAPPESSSPQDYQQTPPRSVGKQSQYSAFVPNQSPLQAVEYGTPPAPRHQHPESYSPSPQPGTPHGYPTSARSDVPVQSYRPRDAYDAPQQYDDRDHGSASHGSQYSSQSELYEMPPMDEQMSMPPAARELPPAPPAHRSRNNSGGPEPVYRGTFDLPSQKSTSPMPMRHDVLKSEAHRNSMPSYPGRPTFRASDSAPSAIHQPHSQSAAQYENFPPRHYSHDGGYEPHSRSMQPTVEDVPDSPSEKLSSSYGYSGSRGSYHDEMAYEREHSPAPLNFSRSVGASPLYGTPQSTPGAGAYQDQGGYGAPAPLPNARDYSTSPGRSSYNPNSGYSPQPHRRRESEPPLMHDSHRGPPPLPSSLVPAVDSALSHDISARIYEERRHDGHYSNPSTPRRGRHDRDSMSYGHGVGNSPSSLAHQQYDRRHDVGYSSGPESQMGRPRNGSPNANPDRQQTIQRKSVSPAPSPSEGRRLSGVPFGPDSYEAFNPSVSPSPSGAGGSSDPDSKIITHDGREIDPSDHLPMESWAPEPEPKPSQKPSEPRARPSPAGAQPMPPSGRRPLRVARPQSMAAPPPAPIFGRQEELYNPSDVPGTAGRNRLQKKANRASASQGSSPLAPISPDNYQERQSAYPPTRGLPRSSTWDYPNENRAPQYGQGPPVPAKMPLPVMSGANGVSAGQGTLMEEMQRIDIGAGRSRRRGGY